MRVRTIDLKIDGKVYSITFRPAILGRVKDIKVYSGKPDEYLLGLDKNVKIETQEISTIRMLKEICVSIQANITNFLLRKFQRRL